MRQDYLNFNNNQKNHINKILWLFYEFIKTFVDLPFSEISMTFSVFGPFITVPSSEW